MRRGFTLLETLVAVAIMMVAIGSAFGLAPEGLVGARFAKNQTTATYLAQEAIETARNIRDNSMFFAADPSDPMNWLSGLSACIGRLCTVDVKAAKVVPCQSSCAPLDTVVAANGQVTYVNHSGALSADIFPSMFTRDISVRLVTNSKIAALRGDAGGDTEAVITARVRWKEGVVTKTTEINETLFDWWTFTK